MRPRALALLRDDETVGESAFGYTQPSPPIWLLASLPASATPTSSILDRQHESTSRGAAPHHPGLCRLCPRLLPLRPGSVPLGSLPRLCLTRRSYPLRPARPRLVWSVSAPSPPLCPVLTPCSQPITASSATAVSTASRSAARQASRSTSSASCRRSLLIASLGLPG